MGRSSRFTFAFGHSEHDCECMYDVYKNTMPELNEIYLLACLIVTVFSERIHFLNSETGRLNIHADGVAGFFLSPYKRQYSLPCKSRDRVP